MHNSITIEKPASWLRFNKNLQYYPKRIDESIIFKENVVSLANNQTVIKVLGSAETNLTVGLYTQSPFLLGSMT